MTDENKRHQKLVVAMASVRTEREYGPQSLKTQLANADCTPANAEVVLDIARRHLDPLLHSWRSVYDAAHAFSSSERQALQETIAAIKARSAEYSNAPRVGISNYANYYRFLDDINSIASNAGIKPETAKSIVKYSVFETFASLFDPRAFFAGLARDVSSRIEIIAHAVASSPAIGATGFARGDLESMLQDIYRQEISKFFPGEVNDADLTLPRYTQQVTAVLTGLARPFKEECALPASHSAQPGGHRKTASRGRSDKAMNLLSIKMGTRPAIECWQAETDVGSVYISRIQRGKKPPEFVFTFSPNLARRVLAILVKPGNGGEREISVIPDPRGFNQVIADEMKDCSASLRILKNDDFTLGYMQKLIGKKFEIYTLRAPEPDPQGPLTALRDGRFLTDNEELNDALIKVIANLSVETHGGEMLAEIKSLPGVVVRQKMLDTLPSQGR